MVANFRLKKLLFFPKDSYGQMGFAPKNVADPEKRLSMHDLEHQVDRKNLMNRY